MTPQECAGACNECFCDRELPDFESGPSQNVIVERFYRGFYVSDATGDCKCLIDNTASEGELVRSFEADEAVLKDLEEECKADRYDNTNGSPSSPAAYGSIGDIRPDAPVKPGVCYSVSQAIPVS